MRWLARATVLRPTDTASLASSASVFRQPQAANPRHDRHTPRFRRARLSASLALALTIPAQSDAGTVTVNRCNDQDGVQYFGNSLRLAINIAVDGDTIDMSGLACSKITLERGEIAIDKDNLTLNGPSDHALTIDAAYGSRVINHSGGGILLARYLDFTHGASAKGGCIVSNGAVALEHSTVSACSSSGDGGGIYAFNATIKYSTITGNTAYRAGGGIDGYSVVLKHSTVNGNTAFGYLGTGGGVYGGSVKAYFSSITGNHSHYRGGAINAGGAAMYDSDVIGNSADDSGGGIRVFSDLLLTRTTISGNSAAQRAGFSVRGQLDAIQSTIDSNTASGTGGGGFAYIGEITNSTISGNHAGCAGGLFGVYLEIANSTIAFNTSGSYDASCAGGVSAYQTTVSSSIIAKNRRNGLGFADFQVLNFLNDPGSLVADASLIVSASVITPSLTSDPLLAPLALHGGAVRTHALLANSPAIDVGSNPKNLETDARGTGFTRVANGAIDIGAYERQLGDDEIFYDGFN